MIWMPNLKSLDFNLTRRFKSRRFSCNQGSRLHCTLKPVP